MRRGKHFTHRHRPTIAAIGFLLLALTLTSCTIFIEPGNATVTTSVHGRITIGVGLSDIITLFEPTRGTGATYNLAENIAFRVRTRQDGYLTLTAIDPDGRVYTFARNIFIAGGQTTVISGPTPRSTFLLQPPKGRHRVRASFTPQRTDIRRVTFVGRRGEEEWSSAITIELKPFPIRDVRETEFLII